MKGWFGVFTAAAVLLLTACSGQKAVEQTYFGFSKDEFAVKEEADTHGGFHGDGMYRLILDCSENREGAEKILNGWAELPLPENLGLILYGGEKDGVYYGYELAGEAGLPVVENGWYCFYDRHAKSTAPEDASALFHRASYNFSLGIYDSSTDYMYYFEYDT